MLLSIPVPYKIDLPRQLGGFVHARPAAVIRSKTPTTPKVALLLMTDEGNKRIFFFFYIPEAMCFSSCLKELFSSQTCFVHSGLNLPEKDKKKF